MPVPVYFRPEQNVQQVASFSPSAGKPAQVVADWRAHGLPIEVCGFEPITRADLLLAHDADYVDGVLAGRLATGFRVASAEIARSTLYTIGSLLAAARAARQSDGGITCSPTSGFHHAGWNAGGGFCTFNGLIVAARRMLADGDARRVAILDLDMHYGNGTDEILEQLGSDGIAHFTAGSTYHRREDAAPFLRRLPEIVAQLCAGAAQRADVLLYQAGADPHVSDPLGGWLTSAQLRERDAIVFETCLGLGVPVAWNLAGGYQRGADGGIGPVLAIHRATMEEAVRVSAMAAPVAAVEVGRSASGTRGLAPQYAPGTSRCDSHHRLPCRSRTPPWRSP
jgi:acetoin utilization deacetylase AcuC-like enzyme